MSASINGTTGLTFPDGSTQPTAANGNLGFKNRIINGAMMIDQRNAGASVTVGTSSSEVFIADRFAVRNASASANCTAQQVSDAPSGFVNSLKITVTATDSTYSTATTYTRLRQGIEANNIADLGWGGSAAQAITLSFWVKSSVIGSFSVSLINSAYNYSYPVSYTISSANTWEQKSITISGPTSGTWATGNNAGVMLEWTLGASSNLLGTSGSWASARYEGVTGQVNLFATNGATFQVTGVQLEKGSTATSFDYRPYGTELALCQRYYYKLLNDSSSVLGGGFGSGVCNTTTTLRTIIPFPVPMRTAPSAIETTGVAGDYRIYITASVLCTATPQYSYGSTTNAQQQFTVASGLTAGQAGLGGSSSTSSNCYLAWSAEL